MKTLYKYFRILASLLFIAGCSSDDDTPVQTDYFPAEIDFSTEDQAFTFNFEYNSLNQVERLTLLKKSELSTTDEFEMTANYDNNRPSSLVFVSIKTGEGVTYTFKHDNFGIITSIDIDFQDGENYEVSCEYSSFLKSYTFDADYATFFPLSYLLDENGNVYSRSSESNSYQYKIETIEGQKGIFHALPEQLEFYLFFELSSLSASIPYFFSPYTIEMVQQKPSPPYSDIQYTKYEYDENGNPVNFNYVGASIQGEYRVRYEERPTP